MQPMALEDRTAMSFVRSRSKFRLRFDRIIGLVVALLVWSSSADAQSTQIFSDWRVVCRTEPDCAMMQTITDDRGRRLLSLKVAIIESGPYLETITPLGNYLQKGIRLRIDDDPVTHTLTQVDCVRDGCRSVVVIDDALLEALKSGGRAAVIFVDSKSGKALSIGASLNGFLEAFAALKS